MQKKLRNIFERLDKANFRIQPEKCVFTTDQVEYLGHICMPQGIRPDSKKVQAIKEYPVPKDCEGYSIICWTSQIL